jgi:hypothetical protein
MRYIYFRLSIYAILIIFFIFALFYYYNAGKTIFEQTAIKSIKFETHELSDELL